VELYRAKQSLTIECHTIQLPQFRDCMTYSAFRCTLSSVKFTLTSRDLLIHKPHAEVLTYILVGLCVFMFIAVAIVAIVVVVIVDVFCW